MKSLNSYVSQNYSGLNSNSIKIGIKSGSFNAGQIKSISQKIKKK